MYVRLTCALSGNPPIGNLSPRFVTLTYGPSVRIRGPVAGYAAGVKNPKHGEFLS